MRNYWMGWFHVKAEETQSVWAKFPETSKQLRRHTGGGAADWSVKVLGCLRRKEWTCVLCTCSEQCVTPSIPIPLLGAALLYTTRHTRQGRGVFTGQSPWPLLFFAALLCFSLLDILISGTATSKSVQLKVENAACLMLKCVDGRQNLKVHFWI